MKDSEIKENLKTLPNWVLNKGRLEKTFIFPNFARAAVFFNKIINPIEESQHYPQIFVAYNRVTISLMTHEEGRLTAKDFSLAQDIEKIAA